MTSTVTLPFCLHCKSVKLCTSISLGEGQLCRGGQHVSRDTGWVTVGQRPIGEHLLHAAWLRRPHTAARLQIHIWMPSNSSSANEVFLTESEKKQVVCCHCICWSCYRGCYQPWQAGCSSGKCPLFRFSGLHKHLRKPSSTRVGTPEFGLLWAKCLETILSGFDGSLCCGNWSRALKAHYIYVPSCGAPLWPTLSLVQKKLL